MKIELLNVRIYVSKNTVVADSIGNRKNEWQPYYTCYATVSAEGGKEMTDAGMVVLRSMSFVNTPPIVSMPRLSGVTSSRSSPLTSPPRTPP